jgi:adenylate cyclase
VRRTLRMTSGLIPFTYIGAHLTNHALGLISLDTAERGMEIAVEVWYSVPGTLLLYGAAATHFLLALWAVYERRTFRLPPLELLRIALGFTLPIILIGHAANTRLAYELFGLSSDYTRVVANLWAADQQGLQLGLLAPGWLHGCLGLNFAFKRRALFRQLRFVLFAIALLLPVFSALGFIAMGRELSTNSPTYGAAVSVHPAAFSLVEASSTPGGLMSRTVISGLVCITFLMLFEFSAVPQEPARKGAGTESGQLTFNNACRTCHTTKEGDNPWARTSTISSEGKPVRFRTTAIPAQ